MNLPKNSDVTKQFDFDTILVDSYQTNYSLFDLYSKVKSNMFGFVYEDYKIDDLVTIDSKKISLEKFLNHLANYPPEIFDSFPEELKKLMVNNSDLIKSPIRFSMPISPSLFTPSKFNEVEYEITLAFMNAKAVSFGPGRINITKDGMKSAPAKACGLNINEESKLINYGLFEIGLNREIELLSGATAQMINRFDENDLNLNLNVGVWQVSKAFSIHPGNGAGSDMMRNLNEFLDTYFTQKQSICLHSRFCTISKELNGFNNDRTGFYMRSKSQGEGNEYIPVGLPDVNSEGNDKTGGLLNWWMFSRSAFSNFKNDLVFNSFRNKIDILKSRFIELANSKPDIEGLKNVLTDIMNLNVEYGLIEKYDEVYINNQISQYVSSGLLWPGGQIKIDLNNEKIDGIIS